MFVFVLLCVITQIGRKDTKKFRTEQIKIAFGAIFLFMGRHGVPTVYRTLRYWRLAMGDEAGETRGEIREH